MLHICANRNKDMGGKSLENALLQNGMQNRIWSVIIMKKGWNLASLPSFVEIGRFFSFFVLNSCHNTYAKTEELKLSEKQNQDIWMPHICVLMLLGSRLDWSQPKKMTEEYII